MARGRGAFRNTKHRRRFRKRLTRGGWSGDDRGSGEEPHHMEILEKQSQTGEAVRTEIPRYAFHLRIKADCIEEYEREHTRVWPELLAKLKAVGISDYSIFRRGQELTAQGNLSEALTELNKALEVNKNSSLAHYRIADIFFAQRNYQSAANEFREALNGDGDPHWTEVWSHIMLGKIFDTTGQRERAVNEYRQAIQTGDPTQGAMDEARKYLEKPYERERRPNGN